MVVFQWVVVFSENVILEVVVLLKNASFVQTGSCGLLRYKCKAD